MTNWPTLILTTLGGGAVGSLITTYAAQSTDRRTARAKARADLTTAENLSKSSGTGEISHNQITAAMDDLDISAMIARLPRDLVALHRIARVRLWAARYAASPGEDPTARDPAAITSARVGIEAGQLLSAAMWHPWLTAPYRWRRTRQLTRLLDAGRPGHSQSIKHSRQNRKQWERDLLKKAKQESKGKNASQ